MVSVVVYFVGMYLLVAIALLASWRQFLGNPLGRVALGLLLTGPVLPYLGVGVLTFLFRDALRADTVRAFARSRMGSGLATVGRVHAVSPVHADVFVTEGCGPSHPTGARSGWMVTLRRDGSAWELGKVSALWTDCGPARGNTLPPFAGPGRF